MRVQEIMLGRVFGSGSRRGDKSLYESTGDHVEEEV